MSLDSKNTETHEKSEIKRLQAVADFVIYDDDGRTCQTKIMKKDFLIEILEKDDREDVHIVSFDWDPNVREFWAEDWVAKSTLFNSIFWDFVAVIKKTRDSDSAYSSDIVFRNWDHQYLIYWT